MWIHCTVFVDENYDHTLERDRPKRVTLINMDYIRQVRESFDADNMPCAILFFVDGSLHVIETVPEIEAALHPPLSEPPVVAP